MFFFNITYVATVYVFVYTCELCVCEADALYMFSTYKIASFLENGRF